MNVTPLTARLQERHVPAAIAATVPISKLVEALGSAGLTISNLPGGALLIHRAIDYYAKPQPPVVPR